MAQGIHGRLFYVGGFDFPTFQARGIQTLQTAHALARAGWGVRLLVQRPAGPTRPVESALAEYGLPRHPRLRIVPLPVARVDRLSLLEIHKRLAITNWSYALACLADLLRIRPRPDAILTRDPRLAWVFNRAWRLHQRPVVYEVHEVFSTRPRDNAVLDPDKLWGVADRTRALEAAVFAESDVLLPLTHACADVLHHEFGVPRGKMTVVPDGTSAPDGPLPPRDPSSRTVVYAGQLFPWKGVDVLLDALARTSEERLIIFGGRGADDPDLVALRARVSDLGIVGRVEFGGFVPHAQVRARIAGAGVAVVPLPDNLMARYFTSPLKVFDYMAAGVPIVASDLPSLREVLVDGDTALLVPPGDPGALAAAIRRLMVSPGLADRLRRTAFEQVRDYSWDARAARIIEALAVLVGA
ncbi:MAG: glycosyltransferase family 4 protein [Chloroflexi bacterium]|nr:glycosyltransferase family 4 protein [Chloroflexota bacterium]